MAVPKLVLLDGLSSAAFLNMCLDVGFTIGFTSGGTIGLIWLLMFACFHPPQCIVIGLQSTGESRTREVLDENDGHLDRFVSAAE